MSAGVEVLWSQVQLPYNKPLSVEGRPLMSESIVGYERSCRIYYKRYCQESLYHRFIHDGLRAFKHDWDWPASDKLRNHAAKSRSKEKETQNE